MIDKKIFLSNMNQRSFGNFQIKKAELSTKYSIGFENISTNLGYWFESKYKFNEAKKKLAVDDFCKSFFFRIS